MLTGSILAVGVLTAVQLAPTVLFALGAGTLADALDRRRLLLVTQTLLALTSLALAALALVPDPPLAAVYVLAFVAGSINAVDQPTRASVTPRLVPPERLRAAIALNLLLFGGVSVVGPAIGGVAIATVGLTGAYLLDVASFAGSLIALLLISPIPPLAEVARPGIAAIREGLAFVRRRPVLQAIFAIDLNATIFGMPTALFPALALDVFRAGPTGLGLLSAALAAGAFVGAALSGWVNRIRWVGRAVVVAVISWGAAIAAFGLATFSFPLALLCLAIAGAADLVSTVLRGAILQLEAPDELRGRITSIQFLVVNGGPRVGDIEGSLVAAVVGPQASVVSGGLLCVVGAVAVARRFPELVRHTLRSSDSPPPG